MNPVAYYRDREGKLHAVLEFVPNDDPPSGRLRCRLADGRTLWIFPNRDNWALAPAAEADAEPGPGGKEPPLKSDTPGPNFPGGVQT